MSAHLCRSCPVKFLNAISQFYISLTKRLLPPPLIYQDASLQMSEREQQVIHWLYNALPNADAPELLACKKGFLLFLVIFLYEIIFS